MKNLSGLKSKEKEEIKQIITRHEKNRVGEIVPVVVERSAPRGFFPHGWLLGVLFIFTLITASFYEYFSDFPVSIQTVLFLLGCGAFFLTSFFLIPSFQRLLIGKKRLGMFVHERALLEFMSEGLHNTERRVGVLILISLFERKIEILSDKGLNEFIKNEEWKKISDEAAQKLKSGELFFALKHSVEKISDHLQIACGAKDKNDLTLKNELDDGVRVKK